MRTCTAQIRLLEVEAEAMAALEAEVLKLRAWKEAKTAELADLAEQVDQANAYQVPSSA
jgi:hypothetical protein